MSSTDLVRDLRLLESAVAARDAATNWQPVARRSNLPSERKQRRPALLQQLARKRGIVLKLMPSGMERHERNSSWLNRKRGELDWRIEWLFTSPSGSHIALLPNERACESAVTVSLLRSAVDSARLRESGLRHKLRPFADMLTRLHHLLQQARTHHDEGESNNETKDAESKARAEHSNEHQRGCGGMLSLELLNGGDEAEEGEDINEYVQSPLKTVLQGREIIEFPTIRVRLL
jgi:hypothetical protein